MDVLHKMDCEVHVAAYDNLATKKGLKLDFVEKVYNLPFARSPKDTSNIKAYKMLKIILDENNYDVVHCNTPMGGIVTRLAAKAVHKRGTKVMVEGRIQTGSYTDRNGNKVYTTDVVIENQEFAESKGNNQGSRTQTDYGDGFMSIPEGEEELPFN